MSSIVSSYAAFLFRMAGLSITKSIKHYYFIVLDGERKIYRGLIVKKTSQKLSIVKLAILSLVMVAAIGGAVFVLRKVMFAKGEKRGK